MNIKTDKRIKKVVVFDTETTPVYTPCKPYWKTGLSTEGFLIGAIKEERYTYKGKEYRKALCTLKCEQVVFDIGWTVAARNSGKIIEKRSYLVKEIFTNMKLMRNAHYFDKYPDYLVRLGNGDIEMKPWREILFQLQCDIEDYRINECYAYNIAFDINAINNTSKYVTGKAFPLWELYSLKTNCLWGMACETILQQKGFRKVAEKENWKSECGNILTNAETTYRYLSGIYDFQEAHTALEDAIIETFIMNRCFKTHKHMSFGIINQPWKLVNQKEVQTD